MESALFDTLDSDGGWIAEVKKNGWRCLAQKESGALTLWTRHRTTINDNLADLRASLSEQLPDGTIIDGELLNNRTKEIKGVYYVFDILMFRGRHLVSLPLKERREILETIIKPTPALYLAEQFSAGKKKLYYTAIESPENEGVVLKKLTSLYLGSTSRCLQHPQWLKVKRPENHVRT